LAPWVFREGFGESEAARNLVKNGGFEELTGVGAPRDWNIQREIVSDQEVTVHQDKGMVKHGIQALKIERYNEKADYLPVSQVVNLEVNAGDTVRFGGQVLAIEDWGGETLYVLSIIDGTKKMLFPSKLVGGKSTDWSLSAGTYTFKFGGKIRYLGISFRPLTAQVDKKTQVLKRARGIYLYDGVFLTLNFFRDEARKKFKR
jgi:hypothetical protein